jgi:GAF domain-containing protein
MREFGFRAAVGVPVTIEGRLWGVMIVDSRSSPPPTGTEARLAAFTDLAAAAISNAQARVELRSFADERAALRRVATLVANAAPPDKVLTEVTEETGLVLHAGHATMSRYDPGGTATVVASCSNTGADVPVGTRMPQGGRNAHTLVFQTGRAARIDDYPASRAS